MAWFFVFIISSYVLLVLVLLFGWARTMDNNVPSNLTNEFLSVIIPFRNEEKNLGAILHDIQQQQYPPDRFEVILVDDHSEDNSIAVATEQKAKITNLSVISLSEKQGKKAAIEAGVAAARGEIIVTTDADCHVQPGWLTQINSGYQNQSTQMRLGAVRINGSSFFARLQAMEFTSVMAVTAGTLGLGFPSMCNGANLSFRKSAFVESRGYQGNEQIPSGDDEFLMRKISDRWPRSVGFLTHRDSVVTTNPQSTLSAFIQQRLRWAGKWRHNSSVAIKSVAILVWLFHVSFLAFATLTFLGIMPLRAWLYGMGAKFFVEALLLFSVSRFVQLKWSWFTFLILQFFYSLYVVSIGFASQWTQAVWKGR